MPVSYGSLRPGLGGGLSMAEKRGAQPHIGVMHLDLTDDEAAALTQELHDIVENDRYPFLPPHPHAEGDPQQAETRAGSRAPVAGEGLCATAGNRHQKASGITAAGSDVLVCPFAAAHMPANARKRSRGMKGRHPPFRSRDGEIWRAVKATAQRKRLPAQIPPEPASPPAGTPGSGPNDMPIGRAIGMEPNYRLSPEYQAARRMALYEQPSRDTPLPLRLSELQEPPTVSQSPPIVPRSVGDIEGGSLPDPKGLAGAEAKTTVGAFTRDVAVGLQGAEEKTAPGLRRITQEFPILVDTTGPLPAARPEVEPDKRKKAARGSARPRSKSTRSAIINRVEVIRQTNALIIVLQEALDYDPVRGHNQSRPVLWSDDPSYLNDVKALVVELRRLNSLMEAKRPRKKEAERAVIDLARHFDKFLHAYASWFGKGTALLTVAVIANLLQHAGLDPTAVCSAIRH
jgi:hypothetical protein